MRNPQALELARALADEARREPAWGAFARFLEEQERGLRKQALHSLDEFTSEASTWDEPERRRFAVWYFQHLEPVDDYTWRTPHPLIDRLLYPTLMKWTEEGIDARPHRWLGIFLREHVLRQSKPSDTSHPAR